MPIMKKAAGKMKLPFGKSKTRSSKQPMGSSTATLESQDGWDSEHGAPSGIIGRKTPEEYERESQHGGKMLGDQGSSTFSYGVGLNQSSNTQASADEYADEEQEPGRLFNLGNRRVVGKAATNTNQLAEHMKNLRIQREKDSETKKEVVGGGGKSPSVIGNLLQNIHSSPMPTPDAQYVPPVFKKSSQDADFIEIALQRNFVFANALSDEEATRKRELRQVVDAFESHSIVPMGEKILSMHEVGEYFYILREGSVRYYTDFEGNPSTDGKKSGECIGRAHKPGQSFGELCLLYDCPPPADCISWGDPNSTDPAKPSNPAECQVPCSDGGACKLWRINRYTFRQILALRTIKKDERMRDALKKIEVLQELDGEFINRIAEAMDIRNLQRGEVLYERGNIEDEPAFFVIGAEGKVELHGSLGGGGGKDAGTRIVGPGEAFGESAISSPEAPRAETATALDRTAVYSMTRKQFDRVVGDFKDAVSLSRDRRLLKSVPLFQESDLEDFEYELLSALFEDIRVVEDKVVLLEGDRVDECALYIVRSGALEVISEDYPQRNRILKAGMYFGEGTLTPDNSMKFGGKGGLKFAEETVDTISKDAILGKLSLANIESVILDLHRLGRRGKKKQGQDKKNVDDDQTPDTLDDLEFHRLFGAGTFGRVWIVSSVVGGRDAYALKIQSKRELLDQRQAGGAQRERSVMAKIDHPFVCKLHNTFQDDACIYMLLSFIQGGELLNLIQGGKDCGGLPESAAKFFAAGILEGLSYMHRRHIVYRDLKPENVLLDKDGYPVIVDFGFSKIVTDKSYTFCGTPLYLAPEIILSRGHDRGVDYWALGCLSYEMLFGITPFYEKGIDQKGLFKRILTAMWDVPKDHNKVSRSAMEFLWGLLQKKSSMRLGNLSGGFRDIKTHVWLQEVNFGKLVKKHIHAPWVPNVLDPLDTSNFDVFDDAEDEDFLKGKAPLTAKEQIVFQDFGKIRPCASDTNASAPIEVDKKFTECVKEPSHFDTELETGAFCGITAFRELQCCL